MESKETVSVVIPTYNRAESLLVAIRSALGQTHAVTEVLVCDDGSSDGSRERVLRIADPRVKWIECGRNGRPAVPRNAGIRSSQGQWVAFLDSDDRWHPEKIGKQLAALKAANARACCCNAERVVAGRSAGPYLARIGRRIAFRDLLQLNAVICSSVLVDRVLLEQVSLFPEAENLAALEDYALWLRLATDAAFVYLPECLLDYSDNPEASIRTVRYTEPRAGRRLVCDDLKLWLDRRGIPIDGDIRALLDRDEPAAAPREGVVRRLWRAVDRSRHRGSSF